MALARFSLFQHELLLQIFAIRKGAGLGNGLPQNDPRWNFVTNDLLATRGEARRDKRMLTPENSVLLTVMQRQRRRIELEALRNEAPTRYRAEELQAQLEELDVDYDHVLQSAVLI